MLAGKGLLCTSGDAIWEALPRPGAVAEEILAQFQDTHGSLTTSRKPPTTRP